MDWYFYEVHQRYNQVHIKRGRVEWDFFLEVVNSPYFNRWVLQNRFSSPPISRSPHHGTECAPPLFLRRKRIYQHGSQRIDLLHFPFKIKFATPFSTLEDKSHSLSDLIPTPLLPVSYRECRRLYICYTLKRKSKREEWEVGRLLCQLGRGGGGWSRFRRKSPERGFLSILLYFILKTILFLSNIRIRRNDY